MKLLALDISSTCTGYARFEIKDNKVVFVDKGHIKAKGKDIYQRMIDINNVMTELGLYEWPDTIAIEGYAFGGSALAQLAEINGIFKYNLTVQNKEWITIAPTTVKKQVAGNGKAKKDEVSVALKEMPMFKDMTFAVNDESDACAVGIAYIKRDLKLEV